MDAQIHRHQPLITARFVFPPKALPPPPIISARMEFPSISVLQLHERSPTPEARKCSTSRHATTPTRRPTPRRAATPRRPTPINTQRAVAFDNNIGPESPLTPKTEESSDDTDSESRGSTKVPKPPGTVGRPQSGGYNLQDKLGWNDTTYQSIQVSC